MEVEAGRFHLTFDEPPGLKLGDLRGVGPKTAERLGERGLTSPAELLLFVPRKYRPVWRHLGGGELGQRRPAYAEFCGQITRVNIPPPNSRAPVEVGLDVDGQAFKLIWFNLHRHGFGKQFSVGDWLGVEGDIDWAQRTPSLAHPTFKQLASRPAEREPEVRVEPIYPSMENVPDALVRSAIEQAADVLLPHAIDIVPAEVLRRRELPGVREALEVIHVLRPYDDLDRFRQDVSLARRRLVYEEFYTLQLKLAHDYVRERRAANAPRCTERHLGRQFVRNLPFELTGDQNAALKTLAADLEKRMPMRRLLQGDVGSGKTVVAFAAAAIAIGSGQQVALMAPTDILAKQHLRRAREFFAGLPVRIGLLTGSQSAGDKREIIAALAGEPDGAADLFEGPPKRVDLVVGTHALFQDDVAFESLGLVIVDEQHKFGVEQRQALLAKGRDPHLLAMTATPIPRSLAHAVFGDLDLTVIREKPPGRKPIRTFLRDRSAAPKVYDYVRERVQATGEQAYFVYPMVEASQAVQGRRNVTDSAERLANGPLGELTVGILHGRMDSDAKDAIMQRFADGAIDVLCATTVVEVGMDVTNATLMVIESPEVFGLSQLHQLRGRVGRGSADSMCILIAGFDVTEEAEERLSSFTSTEDGFELAEVDLKIRGPGEFLGVRQAGLAEFRFGDVVRDAELISQARQDARREVLGDAG